MTTHHQPVAGHRIVSREGVYAVHDADGSFIGNALTYTEAVFLARQNAIAHSWWGQRDALAEELDQETLFVEAMGGEDV